MIDLGNDTIAAISTPPGEGGISVIRVSGSYAADAVMGIFKARHTTQILRDREATIGRIMDGLDIVDEVVVTFFKMPNSYTGEDTVEISCHGSPFVCRRILELLFLRRVRTALPGEFTMRAFINGKMDLAQAEAVADIIHSKAEESRKAAVFQLQGYLSKHIQEMRDELIHVCALLECELDFADEDIEFASKEELSRALQKILEKVEALLASYERGRRVREGMRIVLSGKPNVGKSSILNCLLEKERAIVTSIPGTTRDTVEDVLDIAGFTTIITDTAGLRRPEDPIEKEGILRTEQAIQNADLILCVFDKSSPFNSEDENLSIFIKSTEKQTIALINKTDLPAVWETNQKIPLFPTDSVIEISALKKIGIQALIQEIEARIRLGGIQTDAESTLTNIRHRDCLVKSKEDIVKGQEALSNKMSQEFIALDLRGALDHLGEITGQTVGDEIINKIFTSFCVGK